MFGEFGILGTSLPCSSLDSRSWKQKANQCMLGVANLVVHSPQGAPTHTTTPTPSYLSVTVEVSCSFMSSSGVSTHGKPWAAGQEHPISSGHKATEGLHGVGASWMVLQMPHLGVGQSLLKCIAGTSTLPLQIPVPNRLLFS